MNFREILNLSVLIAGLLVFASVVGALVVGFLGHLACGMFWIGWRMLS